MVLQIANPTVVSKVEQPAKVTGMSKTALVERAVDQLERQGALTTHAHRLRNMIVKMDQLADINDHADTLSYDENGLPH